MKPLTLEAPAKLNLSLRVVRRRVDGFHNIDTVMVKLPGLADRLTFAKAKAFSFHCDDPSVPADESNLVVKAVRAFEKATAISCKLAIFLEKKIPHGAGLAGGSSDAATTLLGLNHIHDQPLTEQELHHIAAGLGSDIPFFLKPGAARCQGRGEIIEPADSPPPLPVLLLKPTFAVSTPDAYGRWKDAVQLPGVPYRPHNFSWGSVVNDLEVPVFQKHRFLAELKLWLIARDEVSTALMSGSGSTVFAILKNLADAEKITTAARAELDPTLWSWAGSLE